MIALRSSAKEVGFLHPEANERGPILLRSDMEEAAPLESTEVSYSAGGWTHATLGPKFRNRCNCLLGFQVPLWLATPIPRNGPRRTSVYWFCRSIGNCLSRLPAPLCSHQTHGEQHETVRTDTCDRAMTDSLLNVTEAASMLGLKPSTLYQWVYERRIAHVKRRRSPVPVERHRQADRQARSARAQVRDLARHSPPKSLGHFW